MLGGIFIIMAFYLLGECCAWLINDFVPGSVLGMMFLFLALSMRWVRPERVRPVARFLCDNMAFFFLPAGVGITRPWMCCLVTGTRIGGGDGDDFVGFDLWWRFCNNGRRIIGHMVKRINL